MTKQFFKTNYKALLHLKVYEIYIYNNTYNKHNNYLKKNFYVSYRINKITS